MDTRILVKGDDGKVVPLSKKDESYTDILGTTVKSVHNKSKYNKICFLQPLKELMLNGGSFNVENNCNSFKNAKDIALSLEDSDCKRSILNLSNATSWDLRKELDIKKKLEKRQEEEREKKFKTTSRKSTQ